MQKPVAHKQSLFDFAVQYCGTAEAALAIAIANNISLTAELPTGTILNIPDGINTDDDIVSYYNRNNVVPATLITITDELENGGIDFMSIEGTFIIT